MGVSPDALDWPSHPGLKALAVVCQSRPRQRVAVAYSGGADSTALLLAAWHLCPRDVVALHVNHGLQDAAAAFEAHARSTCDRLGVPLQVVRLAQAPSRGDSIEEWARTSRYEALAEMARASGASVVLLAHHVQDQAETLLLALTRGAGLPGLAAMPSVFERHGVAFERPWLEIEGPALRAWLARQGVRWMDDPSNAEPRFTRNRIRQQVIGPLSQAFPAYASTFSRSARHAAQAQALLDEMAQSDLAAAGSPPDVSRLQGLSRARQANALRHWLRQVGARQATEAQLDEALRQIAACTTKSHQIQIRVGKGLLRRQGACLAYTPDNL